MAKRTKKPAVRPELRRQWLRRFEEDGESPPQIARADGFDVRTVRKQLEEARQEREMKEARVMVLRQALERHYGDLCAFIEELDSAVSWSPTHDLPILKEKPMWRALREHLPRSPIWKAIQRWEQLVDQFNLCSRQVEEHLEVAVQGRGLKFAQTRGEPGLGQGFIDSINYHVTSLARGQEGLKHVAEFSRSGVTGTGLHEARMGAFNLASMDPDDMANFEPIYLELLDEVTEWGESEELKRVVLALDHQAEMLHDELTTIALRRVVPGRCRYCPL